MLMGAALLPVSGCQVVERHTLSVLYFSQVSAGYAGRFRLATGRWPATTTELEEFSCMPGRAERYGLHRMSCDDVVRLPLRTEMYDEGGDLRLRYTDPAGARLCSLRLRAPASGSESALIPMLVIRTSVFSCSRSPGSTGGVHIR
jgi:hypothetical protein